MGLFSAYDLWVSPMLRDAEIFLPVVFSWFLVQYLLSCLFPRVFGTTFTNLPKSKRDDLVVRAVAICNGILMTGSALCFVTNLRAHSYHFHNEQYKEVEGYRFFRIAIVAYFAWDVVVCFWYKWEWIWKVHGMASFLGAYMLSFPYSDHYGSYFTGMFELSNSPLHLSVILRTLNVKPLLAFASIAEGIFVLMFLVIRVMGGSYVTFAWMQQMTRNLIDNYFADGKLVHGELPIVISMLLLSVVQILQYIWFVEIVKIALGKKTPPGTEATKKSS